ncbi:MAG: hypothetical protein Q7S32_00040 [bacterium]|nr:hypothetical protein [bacterium]
MRQCLLLCLVIVTPSLSVSGFGVCAGEKTLERQIKTDWRHADTVFIGEFQNSVRRLKENRDIITGNIIVVEEAIEAVFKITRVFKGKKKKLTNVFVKIRTNVFASEGLNKWATESRGKQWLIFADVITLKHRPGPEHTLLGVGVCSGTFPLNDSVETKKILGLLDKKSR